jgi:hypothetical protein
MEKLPGKEMLRIEEVAMWFDVHPMTVRNWLQHGLLERGTCKHIKTIRITKQSVVNFHDKLLKKRKNTGDKNEAE